VLLDLTVNLFLFGLNSLIGIFGLLALFLWLVLLPRLPALGIEHSGAKLSVKELSKFIEKLYGRNLDLLGITSNIALVADLEVLILVLADVMDELAEEMLHQVEDADRGDFVTWHLDEVVTNFGLGGVEISSLYEDLLLLCYGILQELHPRNDVAMRHRQLVSLPDFNELVQALLVL
jgi:hypothetical protein